MPIMLVDDNPLMQQVITRILVGHGYDVVVASSGEDALNIAREQRCELLLIDLNLPDQDGPDLLAALRRQSHYAATTAVAISGMGETQRYDVRQSGFSYYLSKPIDLDELLNIVKQHVGESLARAVGVQQI